MEKQYRIKRNEEISRICSLKKKYNSKNFLVYYSKEATNTIRLAISVSKKFGNAVERNHAKRIVREIVRPLIQKYQNINLIVVVKPIAKLSKFQNLKEELTKTISFINNKINLTKSLKEEA